jgi:hypothetical protein
MWIWFWFSGSGYGPIGQYGTFGIGIVSGVLRLSRPFGSFVAYAATK